MRRVEILAFDGYESGPGRVRKFKLLKMAWFHQWSHVSVDANDAGPVAICEDEGGMCQTEPPEYIRFVNPGSDK